MIAEDEEFAILVSPSPTADIFDLETEDYRADYLRSVEKDFTATLGGEAKATQHSHGYGADGYAVLVVLTLGLFLSGKRINENLDAWVAIGTKLDGFLAKLRSAFGGASVSQAAALTLALKAVSARSRSMREVAIVSTTNVPLVNRSIPAEASGFRSRPDAYYLFAIQVEDIAVHVVGIASTGKLLFHHELDLFYQRFFRDHA
jgi:hypothetical protein